TDELWRKNQSSLPATCRKRNRLFLPSVFLHSAKKRQLRCTHPVWKQEYLSHTERRGQECPRHTVSCRFTLRCRSRSWLWCGIRLSSCRRVPLLTPPLSPTSCLELFWRLLPLRSRRPSRNSRLRCLQRRSLSEPSHLSLQSLK